MSYLKLFIALFGCIWRFGRFFMRFLDPLGFDDDARPYTLKATNPTALTVASYTYRHDRHLKQPENPAAVRRPPLRQERPSAQA